MANGVVDLVLADLEGEFPPEAYVWVTDVEWSGPKQVDLADIDDTGREDWAASSEPEKVAGFVESLERDGELQPIVLYETPDFVLHVADGHHRLLAYEQLGQNPVAFVAEVPSDAGPWAEMHSQQNGPASQRGGDMGSWARRAAGPGA
jgi:hypothetical protein